MRQYTDYANKTDLLSNVAATFVCYSKVTVSYLDQEPDNPTEGYDSNLSLTCHLTNFTPRNISIWYRILQIVTHTSPYQFDAT
jgi:hypothetical protein